MAAGYVLPDGSMLNFKRNNRNLIGHGYIKQIFKENLSFGEANIRFMAETGAIRVMKGLWPTAVGVGKGSFMDLGFYWEGVNTIKPTNAQAYIIGRTCRRVEGLCSWSLRNPDGTTFESSKGSATWVDYMRAFERCIAELEKHSVIE